MHTPKTLPPSDYSTSDKAMPEQASDAASADLNEFRLPPKQWEAF